MADRSRSRLAAVMVVIAPSVRRPDVTHVVAAPPRIPGIEIPEWLIWTWSVCDVEVIREGAGRRSAAAIEATCSKCRSFVRHRLPAPPPRRPAPARPRREPAGVQLALFDTRGYQAA